jgi:hypothetical protein
MRLLYLYLRFCVKLLLKTPRYQTILIYFRRVNDILVRIPAVQYVFPTTVRDPLQPESLTLNTEEDFPENSDLSSATRQKKNPKQDHNLINYRRETLTNYTDLLLMNSGITKIHDRKTVEHVFTIFFFGDMSKLGYSSHHCHVTLLT